MTDLKHLGPEIYCQVRLSNKFIQNQTVKRVLEILPMKGSGYQKDYLDLLDFFKSVIILVGGN